MHRILYLFLFIFPSMAFAQGFERPIPNPQTATAEGWFLAASIALLLALLAVHLLVRRR